MAQPDITVSSIGLRARERADMVNSSFISATEEESIVETSWKEFVLRCVERHEDVFLAFRLVQTTVGGGTVSLTEFSPRDVLKFRGAQFFDNSIPGDFLRKIDILEERRVSSGQRRKPTHYSLMIDGSFGMKLRLFPPADAVYTLRVWYVPFQSLRDYTQASSGHFYSLAGWDEYMVVSAAIKMRDKEEGDCAVLLAEKEQLFELMMKTLTPFDEGEPAAVVQQRALPMSIYDDPFVIEDRFGFG